MATSPITLYPSVAGTEVYTLMSIGDSKQTYSGAASTLAAPKTLELSQEKKAIGNLGNDRFVVATKAAAYNASLAKTSIVSATLTISVAKDATAAVDFSGKAVEEISKLISYFTGAAPSAGAIANITTIVAGLVR